MISLFISVGYIFAANCSFINVPKTRFQYIYIMLLVMLNVVLCWHFLHCPSFRVFGVFTLHNRLRNVHVGEKSCRRKVSWWNVPEQFSTVLSGIQRDWFIGTNYMIAYGLVKHGNLIKYSIPANLKKFQGLKQRPNKNFSTKFEFLPLPIDCIKTLLQ